MSSHQQSLHQTLEHQLLLELSLQHALEVEEHGSTAKISTEIMGLTLQHISRLMNDESETYKSIDKTAVSGIAARVARGVVFRLATDDIPLVDAPDTPNRGEGELLNTIVSHIREEFDEWWTFHHDYRPPAKMPSESGYISANGPLDWSKAVTSYERISHSPLSVRENVPADRILESVANIHQISKIPLHLSDIYSDVRTATYGVISSNTFHEIFPKIKASYRHAWLEAEAFQLLKEQKMDEFVRRTRKGIFVYGFDEEGDRKVSVSDEMSQDLVRHYHHDEPTYEGRYLMSADGRLLAWMTYWQTPLSPSDKNGKMVCNYLANGVTGGEMQYTRSPKREFLERDAKDTLMIDTIRGEVPLAAARLMSKVTTEMQHISPYLKRFMGYRLHDLEMNPPPNEKHDHIRLSENLSSSHFFDKRECFPFAYDYSPAGPRSKRDLPDGTEMYLNPEWVAFVGRFGDVREASQREWISIQRSFGDISDDRGTQSFIRSYDPTIWGASHLPYANNKS